MVGKPDFSGGISAMPCPNPDCGCVNVIVRVHDGAGRLIAGIALPRDGAAFFAEQLAGAMAGRRVEAPTDVRLFRCEGTA